MIKDALAVALVLLPQRWRTQFARRVLGWDIHPTARIGRSIIRAGRVTMGPHSWIGHRNTVRGLDELVLKEGASIGGRNTIWAVPSGSPIFAHRRDRHPSLTVGAYGGISTGNEIDCSGGVTMGDYASITGFGGQILSHRLDLARDRAATEPVTIGERTFIMTGCILLSGVSVPSHSIISAGSVVLTSLAEPYTLYRGNPAVAVRELPKNLKLFRRVGFQQNLGGTPEQVAQVEKA